jgi:hypothetical protein
MLIWEGGQSSPEVGMTPDMEISVFNYWLDKCQNNHPECSNDELGFMPTRVVDVGRSENQEPRLVLTADLNRADPHSNITASRYLAVSHCWGSTMPPTATTTLSTIAEHLQTIPMTGLTRTFTDCIGIARRMQVQYLWIDSLCIIQDSREDWEREAAQMASVYSNAYFTIAASSSTDGNGGCHVDPQYAPYGPVVLSFNETDENDKETFQKIRVFSLFGKPIVNIVRQDPLSGRGWTFQERELSNRILHFSKDSVRWECRALQASLQFPWQDILAFNNSKRIFDVGQIGARKPDQQVTEKEKERDHEAWFQAVHNYTCRALTKQPDVLPAFSGIARAVHLRTGDRYLAGLWYSYLVHCLCWASAWHPAGGSAIYDPNKPALITHTRSSEYLAPSWSWACITGKVRYEYWIFHGLDPDPTAEAVKFMARILTATTIPAGLDEYGQLTGGQIRLVGKMRPGFTRGEGFARQDREGVYDFQEGKWREVGMIRYDIPSEAPPGKVKVISCLCMLPRAERYGDSAGLALLPTGKQDEYRRVGLVFLIKLSWYQLCEESQITIV